MKIIASLYVYNFHIIVSYLSEGIKIIPFKDNRSKFFNSKAEYSTEITNINSLTELQANKHVLYGNNGCELTSINLLSPKSVITPKMYHHPVNLDDISQLTINYNQDNLYALSESKGIVQLDISHSRYQEVMSNYTPSILEREGSFTVSNIESSFNYLLIAVRNFGVINTIIDNGDYLNEKELRSEDPQDVKYLKHQNLIVVADSEEGIIVYESGSVKPIKKVRLPNNDFPQQIEVSGGIIIIKGTVGLYACYVSNGALLVLRDGKVGALAVYYDYVFFTSKGKVYSLTLGNSFENHGFSYDKREFDLELIRNKG